MSLHVTFPNCNSWSERRIFTKHKDMLPSKYVDGDVDLKHQRDGSEPVESCQRLSVHLNEMTMCSTPSTHTDCNETASKYFSAVFGALLLYLVVAQLETIFVCRTAATSSTILSPASPCWPRKHCRKKSTQESLKAFGDFTAFPTVGSKANIESKKQLPLPGTVQIRTE